MIEAAIASALLLTATMALTKFVVSSQRLGIAADERLASRLVTENAIERLQLAAAENWPEQAEAIAQAVSTASGIKTQIETDSFQIGDRDAWHAIVRCQIGNNETAFQENHIWKVVQ